MQQPADLAHTIQRIQEMELYYDTLQEALAKDPASFQQSERIQAMLEHLAAYYENGQWLVDYACDERGELPPWLKRGVLSEDGVYDLLCNIAYAGADLH